MNSLKKHLFTHMVLLFFLIFIFTIILCFIIPPEILNFPSIEFINLLSYIFNFDFEFEKYNFTYIVIKSHFSIQLSNELSGFIFVFFIIFFCFFTKINWKEGLFLTTIFIPANFFLNLLRLIELFTLSFDLASFYFYDIILAIIYYILIFTLFLTYLLFRSSFNLTHFFQFRFVLKKPREIYQMNLTFYKKRIIKSLSLIYIITSSLCLFIPIYTLINKDNSTNSNSINIHNSFKSVKYTKKNDTLYLIWITNNNIKLGSYSYTDQISNSQILIEEISDAHFSNPFIEYDKNLETFFWTCILESYYDEILINQTEISTIFQLNLASVPPLIFRSINEYYFTLDINQEPIFIFSHIDLNEITSESSSRTEIVFSYNLSNTLTLINQSSNNYRICRNNLDEMFFLFRSNNTFYYSLIKDKNFSNPQTLSNIIDISDNIENLNVFCDFSNNFYFSWIENQTKIYITSNKTGIFETPILLFNSTLPISNPIIKYYNDTNGFMTFCDNNYQIYFFELINFSIEHSRVFSNNPYVFPNFEIINDSSVTLFWREILNMENTIEESENSVVLVNYLGNGIYSDLVHIS